MRRPCKIHRNSAREAFGDALDAYLGWETGKPEPAIDVDDGREFKISEVCGALWNFTDIMPRLYIDALNDDIVGDAKPIPEGTHYSVGARRLIERIKEVRMEAA